MQPGDVVGTAANIEKLRAVSGFTPTIGIQQGVRNFVDWYKEYYNVK